MCRFQKYFCLCFGTFWCCYLIPFCSGPPLFFHIERSFKSSKGSQLLQSLLYAPHTHRALERVKPFHFHLLFSEYLLALLIFSFSQCHQIPSFHFLLLFTPQMLTPCTSCVCWQFVTTCLYLGGSRIIFQLVLL